MTRQIIDSKNPPLVWSTVEEAFDKINQNFVNLYATISDGSGSVVDFQDLSTNVSPSSSGVYDLGSLTKRWRDLYLTGSTIDLGGAQISSPDGLVVNLPTGSTVGGELIRNPQESSFKTIRVAGQSDVVADDFVGILNFAGAGITISNNADTDTVTFTNAGVTSLSASTGLSINSATGGITITNVGVTQATAGSGISLNQGTGSIIISNTGVLELEQGSGMTLTDLGSGRFRITNGAPNVAQNVFNSISIPLQPLVQADSPLDVLSILPGPGINITTNPGADSITFSVESRLDILGSVFSTDSTVIVDGINSVVYARLEGDVIGSVFSDNSTLLVNGPDGKIVGDVDSNIVQAQTSMQSQLYTNKSGQSLLLVAGQPGTTTVGLEGSEETGATAGGLVYVAGGTNSTDTAAGGDVQIFGGTGLGGGDVTLNGGNGKNGGAGGNTTLAGGANTDGTAQGGDIFVRGGRDLIGGVNHGRVYIGDQFTSEVLLTNPRIVGILDGDIAGSVFADDSTPIIDAIDKKVFATVEGNIFTNLIDSTDSSIINIVPSVNCNSDLTVGGDILPNADFGGNLGSPTQQWKSLYVSSSTIFIGGVPISVVEGQLSVNGSTVIGGGGGPVSWNDVTGKPTFAAVSTSGAYGDLSGTPTLAAVATSGDYTDLSNPPSIPSLGSIIFVGTIIDSDDSSAITFTPAVVLNSDLTVENQLFVSNDATISGTLNVSTLNITGTITSQGSGTPELFSDNEILLTAGTRVEVSSSPLKMASFTSGERDALSPINGDVIYNSTTNKFQGYAGGSWVDLH